MLQGKVGQTLEEFFPSPGGDDSQPQTTLVSRLKTPHIALGCLLQLQYLLGVVVQHLSGFGEPNLPGSPFQQFYPAFLLQILDLQGHRRLGQVQPPGTPGNGAFLDHRRKTNQLF